jgi:hypothetical protein
MFFFKSLIVNGIGKSGKPKEEGGRGGEGGDLQKL